MRYILPVSIFLLAGLSATALGHAPAALAGTNCGSPNFYSYGVDATGNRFGIQGNIQSYNDLNNSYSNENFTVQSMHVGQVAGAGLEIGWFEGWGNQIQAYVTDAHAFSTANGPREVDGPQVTNTNSFYIAYWQGGGLEHYGARSNGQVFFEGTISTDGNNGPGTSLAVGEVFQNGTIMQGSFTNLEHEFGLGGSWYAWPQLTVCADPGYTALNEGPNSFADLTNP